MAFWGNLTRKDKPISGVDRFEQWAFEVPRLSLLLWRRVLSRCQELLQLLHTESRIECANELVSMAPVLTRQDVQGLKTKLAAMSLPEMMGCCNVLPLRRRTDCFWTLLRWCLDVSPGFWVGFTVSSSCLFRHVMYRSALLFVIPRHSDGPICSIWHGGYSLGKHSCDQQRQGHCRIVVVSPVGWLVKL